MEKKLRCFLQHIVEILGHGYIYIWGVKCCKAICNDEMADGESYMHLHIESNVAQRLGLLDIA